MESNLDSSKGHNQCSASTIMSSVLDRCSRYGIAFGSPRQFQQVMLIFGHRLFLLRDPVIEDGGIGCGSIAISACA